MIRQVNRFKEKRWNIIKHEHPGVDFKEEEKTP